MHSLAAGRKLYGLQYSLACGISITLTPPATPAADSAARMPLCAMCSATRELLHAVSVLTHGPCGFEMCKAGMALSGGSSKCSRGCSTGRWRCSDGKANSRPQVTLHAWQQHTSCKQAHLQAKGVRCAADQERQTVADDGVGVAISHTSRCQHTIQILCTINTATALL